MKKIFKGILYICLILLLLAILLVAYLSATEYRPAPVETIFEPPAEVVPVPQQLRLITWNIGYAGLGAESDFFMDGGTMVNPPNSQAIDKNLSGIATFLKDTPADLYLLQEVDRDSKHSKRTDQATYLADAAGLTFQFAPNYRVRLVPFPWPPIGKVDSGLMTAAPEYIPALAERHALPVPFSWPVRLANLKRCLLVSRYPTENGKELVLINLHLEAYDDGAGKKAQTKQLLDLMQKEYAKGNYVIAGGDWNQYIDPNVMDNFNLSPPELWQPAVFDLEEIPEGWKIATDPATPSFRLNNRPYEKGHPETYVGVIDGFLLSPNVKLIRIETKDLDFQFSDHQPVLLDVELLD